MVVQPEDLTAQARIRNAALALYAGKGSAGTSVRDVAQAAGVSAGLVQHYFPTKADLRAAVNRYVVHLATSAFADVDSTATATAAESAEELGRRITAFIRSEPDALTYVARGVIDGDDDALALFDAFVALATGQIDRLHQEGLLADDVDLAWAPLHVVILNLATLLMRTAIERHLPEPLLAPTGLERWRVANTSLFREGLYGAG
jgi:AcrR family transcriptional regulator